MKGRKNANSLFQKSRPMSQRYTGKKAPKTGDYGEKASTEDEHLQETCVATAAEKVKTPESLSPVRNSVYGVYEEVGKTVIESQQVVGARISILCSLPEVSKRPAATNDFGYVSKKIKQLNEDKDVQHCADIGSAQPQ